ncbi:hypothetical protein [Micromonospora avicenniae]|uniref:hypothetical protein n=1 Tax=Micromonospora avicenniae TaxID=1198245 RepID=UPI003332670C
MFERVAEYVTEETWNNLFNRRRRRRCERLARVAAEILTGKKMLHDLVGVIAAWLAAFLGGDRVVQAFRSSTPVGNSAAAGRRGARPAGYRGGVVLGQR